LPKTKIFECQEEYRVTTRAGKGVKAGKPVLFSDRRLEKLESQLEILKNFFQ